MWPVFSTALAATILFNSSNPPRFGETIVVTPTMRETESTDVAEAVTIVDSEMIRDRGISTVAEAIELLPGITLLRSGSPGKVASLFTRGTESDHTLILYDGIRMNSPYFAGMDLTSLPVHGIDRIEVVRGPFSPLYGTGAVGGVIQIFPDRNSGTAIDVGAGGYGYRHFAGRAASHRLSLDFSRHEEDGLSANDGWKQSQAIIRADWEHAGILYRYGDQDVKIPFSGGVPTPNRMFSTSRHELIIPMEWTGDITDVQASIGYSTESMRFSDPDDPWGFTSGKTDTRRVEGRFSATRTLAGWEITAGLEGRLDSVDDRSNFGPNLDDSRIANAALFLQGIRSIHGIDVTLGVRGDRHSRFGSTVNPRLSFAWHLGRGVVTAAYGTSFRAPSVGELYFPLSGNPDLTPERGSSIDIGYRLSGNRARAEVHLFYTKLSDLIDFDYSTYGFRNTGRSRITGMEFEAGTKIPGGVELVSAFTLLDHENLETGRDLLRRPGIQGSLRAAWQSDMGLRLLAEYRFVGRRWDVDPVTFTTVHNSSFGRLDIMARYPAHRFEPYLRIENLLDADYEEVLGFPAPGRRFIFGIRFDSRPVRR